MKLSRIITRTILNHRLEPVLDIIACAATAAVFVLSILAIFLA